jgi:hypothetical protein
MIAAQAIHFVRRQQINTELWDACINASANGLIYATSIYLDAMCNSQWCALVNNDYSTVMPLPNRKKYGIKYIYQPAMTQQSGIFSIHEITADLVNTFIKKIPSNFWYIETSLNAANTISKYPTVARKNYLLDITKPYAALKSNYHRSAKRNIHKAIEQGIEVKMNISPTDIIAMHRQRFNDSIGAKNSDYVQFEQLANQLIYDGKCFTIGAFNAQQQLIAGSIYWVFKNRITFILNGNLPESLACGATHLLKDKVIEQFSGGHYWLDFEGSDFPQFARFYNQFGNTEIEYYQSLIINKLLWPIKLLKRRTLFQNSLCNQ